MKRRKEYSWQYTRAASGGLVRDARRNEVLGELLAMGPRAVYGDCLDFAIRSGSEKATGYAAHLFREIFGTWPRPRDLGPPAPLPNYLVDEWAAGRKKSRRLKADKPAPLLDRFPGNPLPVDADGFVPDTLMRPEDFEASRVHNLDPE